MIFTPHWSIRTHFKTQHTKSSMQKGGCGEEPQPVQEEHLTASCTQCTNNLLSSSCQRTADRVSRRKKIPHPPLLLYPPLKSSSEVMWKNGETSIDRYDRLLSVFDSAACFIETVDGSGPQINLKMSLLCSCQGEHCFLNTGVWLQKTNCHIEFPLWRFTLL